MAKQRAAKDSRKAQTESGRKGKTASARRSSRSVMAIAAAVIAVLLIGGLIVYNARRSDLHPALAKVVERYPSEGTNHVPTGQRVTYRTDPPHSGPHYAQWAPPGFYDRPLPDELLVHNLEHGHVIIHYRPDALTPEIEEHILALTRSWTDQWAAVIAVPRPMMENAFTLAAWQHLMRLDEYDEELVDLFIDAFIGRGPENPVR